MKARLIVLIFLVSISSIAFSQNPGEWMWIHGDSIQYPPSNFGVQGISSPNNNPPALYETCEWRDTSGNFWFYGGVNKQLYTVNDLWKYDPKTNEWTWMTGNQSLDDTGSYGIQGVPSPSNRPPAKGWGTVSWVDFNNNLWMFGGWGKQSKMNDLWKYNIATNEWTWMKGPKTRGDSGDYGIQGISSLNNNPASRGETAAAWTDNNGDLWFFGGNTYSDLWRYNIATNTWTWMKGSSSTRQPANYGIKGIEDSLNSPGGRLVYCRWKDLNGNFWLFGGLRDSKRTMNDLWKYNILTNNWTWVNGDSSDNVIGIYGLKCQSSPSNKPGSRYENRASWVDLHGDLWMMGGVLDGNGPQTLNDMWKYSISTNQWTWVSGDSTFWPTGSWGVKGVSKTSNKPNARCGAIAWSDNKDRFYLFGDAYGYSDLWVYRTDSTCGSIHEFVKPLASSNLIEIYPNPINGFFNILLDRDIKEGQINVFNAMGALAHSENFSGNEKKINCYLSSGIYFVQVTDGKKYWTQKIIKE